MKRGKDTNNPRSHFKNLEKEQNKCKASRKKKTTGVEMNEFENRKQQRKVNETKAGSLGRQTIKLISL